MERWNEEEAGFKFLGFEIRQFKVGRHHSGKTTRGNALGHKTIIRPSKEAIKRHYETLNRKCDEMKTAKPESLITQLNPVIRGWCNYQSPWNSKETFTEMSDLLWKRLWRWAVRRHPNKGKRWIAKKYFGGSTKWSFVSREGKNPLELLKHSKFPAGVRWTKVEGTRSPYDGDEIYWSKRVGDRYLTLDPQKSRLLKRQKGKCAHCGKHFFPDDRLEKHHLEKKSKGGNNADKNLLLVHLHCHDQIHRTELTEQAKALVVH